MRTRVVELGDVCDFLDSMRRPVSEELRSSGPYPYYGANGQQGWIDGYIFDEPLILLAEDGGHFGSSSAPIAYRISGKTWVNNHAHVLRPSNECDRDYLMHVLNCCDVTKYVSGSTRPKLTKGNAETIRFPLPDLAEQRRIAAQLEQADRLRRTRRCALELSDTFLPATFRRMFGTTDSPTSDVNLLPLGNQLSFVTSGARGWAEHYTKSGSRFIRSLDVRMNEISDEDTVFVAAPKGAEADRTRVLEDDVLLTITGSQIGRVAAVPAKLAGAYVSQHVAILRLKPGLLPIFTAMFLSLKDGGQREIERLQYGQTKPGLNFDQIREFRVPVPSLPKQRHFAELVIQHERLRATQRESLRQAEHLFQTLLHRAFSPA